MLTAEQIREMLPKDDIKSIFQRYVSSKVVPFATADRCNGIKASDAVYICQEIISDCAKALEGRIVSLFWALEQFEQIKGCHNDCNCTEGEHKMFHIADDAIQKLRFGKIQKGGKHE